MTVGRLALICSWVLAYEWADDCTGLAWWFEAQSGAVFGMQCEGVSGAFVEHRDASLAFRFFEAGHDRVDVVEVFGKAGAEQPSVDHQGTVDDVSFVALIRGQIDAVFDAECVQFAGPGIPNVHAAAPVDVEDVDWAVLLEAFDGWHDGYGSVDAGAGERHRLDEQWDWSAVVVGGADEKVCVVAGDTLDG